MTLHALRKRIGDDAFFRLLRRWVRPRAGGHNVTIPQFIALAEQHLGSSSWTAFFRDVALHAAQAGPGITPRSAFVTRARGCTGRRRPPAGRRVVEVDASRTRTSSGTPQVDRAGPEDRT